MSQVTGTATLGSGAAGSITDCAHWALQNAGGKCHKIGIPEKAGACSGIPLRGGPLAKPFFCDYLIAHLVVDFMHVVATEAAPRSLLVLHYIAKLQQAFL